MTKGAFKVNGEKVSAIWDSSVYLMLMKFRFFFLQVVDNDLLIQLERIRLPEAPDLTLICWGKRKFQLVEWV